MSLNLPGPVAFALGGGASLGALQVGMLQALAERGVFPDLVVGTSVGAINGAVLAERRDPAAHERLARIWSTIGRRDVLPGWLLHPLANVVRSRRSGTARHTHSPKGIEQLFNQHMTARRFDDLALPFAAVATDARLGDAVTLTEGFILDAIKASAAIPGVFPPMSLAGRSLIDGGLSANLPIGQALAMGAGSIVVLDVLTFTGNDLTEPAPTFVTSAQFAAGLLMRSQAETSFRSAGGAVPVVYLGAPSTPRINPLDFSHSHALIAAGYTAGTETLRSITVDGPGIYGGPRRPRSTNGGSLGQTGGHVDRSQDERR